MGIVHQQPRHDLTRDLVLSLCMQRLDKAGLFREDDGCEANFIPPTGRRHFDVDVRAIEEEIKWDDVAHGSSDRHRATFRFPFIARVTKYTGRKLTKMKARKEFLQPSHALQTRVA